LNHLFSFSRLFFQITWLKRSLILGEGLVDARPENSHAPPPFRWKRHGLVAWLFLLRFFDSVFYLYTLRLSVSPGPFSSLLVRMEVATLDLLFILLSALSPMRDCSRELGLTLETHSLRLMATIFRAELRRVVVWTPSFSYVCSPLKSLVGRPSDPVFASI